MAHRITTNRRRLGSKLAAAAAAFTEKFGYSLEIQIGGVGRKGVCVYLVSSDGCVDAGCILGKLFWVASAAQACGALRVCVERLDVGKAERLRHESLMRLGLMDSTIIRCEARALCVRGTTLVSKQENER